MRRYSQALDESQDGVESDFAEAAFDPRDMRLRETDELGNHVLPADRRARSIELGNLAEIVIGECLTHLRLGPEIERKYRGQQLYGVDPRFVRANLQFVDDPDAAVASYAT